MSSASWHFVVPSFYQDLGQRDHAGQGGSEALSVSVSFQVWPETRAAPDKELRPLLGVTGLLHKEQSPLPGQLFSSRVTPETPE